MREIETRDDFPVDLVQIAGGDSMICQAARVSTIGELSLMTAESAGLINFLMKNRHGSPFEHGLLSFRITAPIFVWREMMRHRVASYNEQSGRYMEMDGVFYIPGPGRKLTQVGKAGAYTFEAATPELLEFVEVETYNSYMKAWEAYQAMLGWGVAKEVARIVLPLALYSTAYVTMNPRGLMNFLSLRTIHPDSTYPSFPMWEISNVADQMEGMFRAAYPLTWEAFNINGRVCP